MSGRTEAQSVVMLYQNSGTGAAVRTVQDRLRDEVTPEDYLAEGDGVTDDSAAILKAYANCGAGGVVKFAGRGKTYRTTLTLLIQKSITLDLNGNDLLFDPSDAVTNEKFLVIHSGDSPVTDLSARRPITGALAKGATTFTATAGAGDTADLVQNVWLLLEETDSGVDGEIVFIDWVQVKSKAGAVVTLWHPLRMDFPATHSGVTFRLIIRVVENVTVRNGVLRTTNTATALLPLSVGVARNVTIDNVVSTPAKGNAFYTYRAADVKFHHCRQDINIGQASEFASTVDLDVDGCTFSTNNKHADTSALVLDYGTAFFNLRGNKLINGANIMAQFFCVHDGVVDATVLGYVRDAGITNCLGFGMLGIQRLIVTNNIGMGGAGLSTGIACGDTTTLAVQIPSIGNVFADNLMDTFTTPLSIMPTAGAILGPNGTGGYLFTSKVVMGLTATPEKLLNFKGALADLALHAEITGVGNIYWGPHKTDAAKWAVAHGADTGYVFHTDQSGDCKVYRDLQVARHLDIVGNVGFYGAGPQAKPAVTGSRGGNAALLSLVTALKDLGLITDTTS